ncbi:helix-turn-helix domain-containing protein [Terrilactibacillus sp. BCM23-1]|uniref:Helix-turn-helix domain-containing protein n=1 Tax=Terrilactibacillus tamarindi TaxID=2599694 RepID=A0A6N8CM81_9BACI|nr:helix-turn-helix domain-containing protein [Terrilactibacillus tamarindi]MTT31122.1 helix-turn-helix domain-containing protein [Terrilactibacillus tamarindi]
MNDVYYLNDLEQLKVLCDPFRISILWQLDDMPKTGKMLADKLKLSPSKVRYHLKELERAELVKVVNTSEKNGIVQKFYQPIAKIISTEKIMPIVNGLSPQMIKSLEKNTQLALERSKTFANRMNSSETNSLIQISDSINLSKDDYDFVKEKIKELYTYMREHNNKEKKHNNYHVNISIFPIKQDDKKGSELNE